MSLLNNLEITPSTFFEVLSGRKSQRGGGKLYDILQSTLTLTLTRVFKSFLREITTLVSGEILKETHGLFWPSLLETLFSGTTGITLNLLELPIVSRKEL